MTDRRRNAFILLIVAGLIAASVAVIATKKTRLGLALKGGVELVYQAKPTAQSKVDAESLERAIGIMRSRVDKLGVAQPEIQRSGEKEIDVALPNVSNASRAQDQVGKTAQLYFYDWEPNVIGPTGQPAPTDGTVTGDSTSAGPGGVTAGLPEYQAVQRAAKRPPVLRKNETTLAPGCTAQQTGGCIYGTWYLLDTKHEKVLRGPEETQQNLYTENYKVPVGATATPVRVNPGTLVVQARPVESASGKISNSSPNSWYVMNDEPVLTGADITHPQQGFDEGGGGNGQPNVNFGFTSHGKSVFEAVTKKIAHRGQEAQLPGVSKEAAQQHFAVVLALLAGFALVCVFLLLFYRVLGAIAVGGLLIYGLYFFALIKLIPITLTLPGIAGLILTIGVAADANIVIFERVKEEIRNGRSIIAGIAHGYKRGFAAIVDANVVTFMTAFILFALATAEVKGFAFTLGIGTLVSLFTAVLATQAALGAMGRSRLVTHPAALGAARRRRGWTCDFMGASKWFFSLSGTILLIGALAIGGKGLNFGISFKSGTRIQTAFVKPVSEAKVAEALSAAGYPNAQVQKFTNASIGGTGYQISTKTLAPEAVKKVQALLDTRFGNGPNVPGTKNFSSTSIGPTFGKTVANSAVIAIIASLLVISAYIALRFEWKYAVPVLIALMHDLLITAGVYSLTGR